MLKTALIDLDPQASAYQWNESREDGRKLDAVRASSDDSALFLQQAKAGKIDLPLLIPPPTQDSAAAIAAQFADFVLIPCHLPALI